jgi:hypothetical protein
MNRTCTVGVGGGMESQRAGPFDLQDLPAPRDDLLFPIASVVVSGRRTS